jgi:hypothetical protein
MDEVTAKSMTTKRVVAARNRNGDLGRARIAGKWLAANPGEYMGLYRCICMCAEGEEIGRSRRFGEREVRVVLVRAVHMQVKLHCDMVVRGTSEERQLNRLVSSSRKVIIESSQEFKNNRRRVCFQRLLLTAQISL